MIKIDHVRVKGSTKGYRTAFNALHRFQPYKTVKGGLYWLINTGMGMYLIGKKKSGSGAVWVNPGKKGGSVYKTSSGSSGKSKSSSKNNKKGKTASTKTAKGASDGTLKVSAAAIFGTGSSTKRTVATTPVYTKNTHKASGTAKVAFDSYIKNLLTGSTITFIAPADVSDSVSAAFDQADIRGRSNPIQGYNTSGPREVSFSLDLSADYTDEELATMIAKFKALVYPNYDNYVEPPHCYLKLGNAVKGQFICSSVDVNYSDSPIRDNFYSKATVSLSFTEVVEIPYTANEIERKFGMSVT